MMISQIGVSGFRHFVSPVMQRNLIRGMSALKAEKERYIHVPMSEKDEAKKLGARWDEVAKKWFVPDDKDLEGFAKWKKVFLNVPLDKKDEVKSKGAAWDIDEKKWFVNAANAPAFAAWIVDGGIPAPSKPKAASPKATPVAKSTASNKVYLNVPYEKRDEAKELGARWDGEAKKWYTMAADLTPFADWTESATPQAQAPRPRMDSGAKVYLNVPFEKRDEVKKLGARWDGEAKKWYTMAADLTPFAEWAETAPSQPQAPKQNRTPGAKVYLNVPFEHRDAAKKLGARWDGETKKWYTTGNDLSVFSQWLNDEAASNDTPVAGNVDSAAAVPTANKKKANKKSAAPAAAQPVYPPSSDVVTLITIDTNGLPNQNGGKYFPYEDIANYDGCRIVQLSYTTCNKRDFQPIENHTFIIQSDGFPIKNVEFHSITESISKSKGIPFREAAKNLMSAINKSDHIMAHNLDFLSHVLKSEMYRYGLTNELDVLKDKKMHCSMEMTTGIVPVKDVRNMPKKPTLRELVQHVANEELPKHQGSKINNEYLRKVMQMLVNTDKVNLDETKQN